MAAFIAHGRGRQQDVKAGDVVLFGNWSATEVKIDGEELFIMGVIESRGKFKAAA